MMIRTAILAVLCLLTISRTCAFVAPSPQAAGVRHEDMDTSLNFFGKALAGAFDNADTGPKQNAGLSGGPMATEVTINGKKVQAVANQKVRVVAQAARVKINYSCEAGSCGTCRIQMNGREVRACQALVTPKKCVINTR